MSSPIPKHNNSNESPAAGSSLNKQRKPKPAAGGSLSNKSNAGLDTRSELADLVKRKAEISVSE